MGSELSMGARFEVTAKYAKAYAKVAKKDKGRLLDEVVAVTGWSRDNARRRLAAAAKPRPRAMKVARKRRARKYSYDGVCQTNGVTGLCCHAGLGLLRRPSNRMSKALRASFHLWVQRALPLPVGSSAMTAR